MGLPLQDLETSFDLIAPRGDELVDTFYTRLFETAPAVEPLFEHTELPKQKAMLEYALKVTQRANEVDEADSAALRENPLGDPHRRTLPVYLPPSYDADPARRLARASKYRPARMNIVTPAATSR